MSGHHYRRFPANCTRCGVVIESAYPKRKLLYCKKCRVIRNAEISKKWGHTYRPTAAERREGP